MSDYELTITNQHWPLAVTTTNQSSRGATDAHIRTLQLIKQDPRYINSSTYTVQLMHAAMNVVYIMNFTSSGWFMETTSTAACRWTSNKWI